MNRAARRATARTERRSAHTKVAAFGSAAVLASAGAGAALVLSSAPAGANAPIVVTSLTDDGSGGVTLREAIEQANTDGGQDQITFSVTGTITLTSDLTAITDPVHINGPGAASLTIDGADTYRVLQFDHVYSTDGDNEVTGLTITHGDSNSNPDNSGGALQIFGGSADMLIEDVVFTDNYSHNDGGAIHLYDNSGSVVINRAVLTNNTAYYGGGALYASEPTEAMNVLVTNSTITGNEAGDDGGGLYFDIEYGSITILDSVISGNSADSGGGIQSEGAGAMTIGRTTISGNEASSGGGGGMMALLSTTVQIYNSTISDNSANGYGGGLYSDAYAFVIVQSTISGNTANQAGGIYTGDKGGLAMLLSTVTGNTATAPGSEQPAPIHGIQLGASTLVLGSADGPRRAAEGSNSKGDAHAPNASHARTTDGTGFPPGVMMGIGVIVAGNGDGTTGYDIGSYSAPPASGIQIIGSVIGTVEPINVIVQDAGGNQTGVTAAALKLGPLADNGGPTKTHALLDGSVAIDAGPATTDLPTFDGDGFDQRGTPYTRIVNGKVDVGAYEVQLPPPEPEPTFTG